MTWLIWLVISMALLLSATSLVLTLVLIRIIAKHDTVAHTDEFDRKMRELEDRLAENLRAADRMLSNDESRLGFPDRTVCLPLSDEIIRLSGQGLDDIEIARRLDINVGEVELVLGLQRCRGSA